MTLGENISKLMKEKGYTVRQFADMVNMSPSYLSDIRNDRQDPSLKKLREIAIALDVELYELLKIYREDHDKKNNIPEDNYNTYCTGREEELLKMYKKLPNDVQNEVFAEIKGMLKMVERNSCTKGDTGKKAM